MVSAYSCPAPPLARTTAPARTRRGPPSLQGSAGHPAVGGDQVDQEGVLGAADGGGGPHRLGQGPLQLGPGGVAAGVDDPRPRVPALPGPGQLPVQLALPVEADPAGAQVGDGLAALGGQHPDRHRVAQPGPGGQGVGHVLGHRHRPGRARPRSRPGHNGWPSGRGGPWWPAAPSGPPGRPGRPTARPPRTRPPAHPLARPNQLLRPPGRWGRPAGRADEHPVRSSVQARDVRPSSGFVTG